MKKFIQCLLIVLTIASCSKDGDSNDTKQSLFKIVLNQTGTFQDDNLIVVLVVIGTSMDDCEGVSQSTINYNTFTKQTCSIETNSKTGSFGFSAAYGDLGNAFENGQLRTLNYKVYADDKLIDQGDFSNNKAGRIDLNKIYLASDY